MEWTLRHVRYFSLTTLTASILTLNQSIFALELMQDSDLRKVDGQDGVELEIGYNQIAIDKMYWEDQVGTANNTQEAIRTVANNVNIGKNLSYNNGNGAGNYTLSNNLKVNVGANTSDQVGIDIKLKLQPFTASIGGFQLCSQTAGVCNPTIGNFALQTGSPLEVGLKTTDGLFNQDAQAELKLGLENINIYTGLQQNVSGVYDQLVLKNTNFNFLGRGVAYIHPADGFVLNTNVGGVSATKSTLPNNIYGYVDLTRVSDPDQTGVATGTYAGTSSGLNLEIMTKSNVTINSSTPVYNLNDTKGLIRVGASGRIVNGSLQIRGVNASDQTNNVLGYASLATQSAPTTTNGNATVIGSSGIGFRMKGEFTANGDSMLGGDNSKSTKLEIGGAGNNTFGFEFSELKPLNVGNTSQGRAYFDSGNVYINMANTKHLQMPVNTVLNNSRLGGTVNTFLTSNQDYIQQIHNLTVNPYSVVLAIRGTDFQAISTRGRFTSSSGVSAANAIAPTAGLDNQWGLGLPFYNLNANMAMYSTNYSGNVFKLDNSTQIVSTQAVVGSQRIGFALAMSVEGKSADGSKTTSILVIDGGDRDNNVANGIQPTNYYFGLRNVDMLLRGYGSIGLENGNVNISLPNLLMAMSAELAAGYLPGAQYKSNSALVAPADTFNLKNDVLMGLTMKLLGDMNFSLIPNNQISANSGNRLSIIGEYKLTEGTVQISDPIDGSMIGLDNMKGLVQFNNAIEVNKDTVGFKYAFDFNPRKEVENVFRVRDVNLYPPVGSVNNRGQRLGEMVMTGGRLTADLMIKPRN